MAGAVPLSGREKGAWPGLPTLPALVNKLIYLPAPYRASVINKLHDPWHGARGLHYLSVSATAIGMPRWTKTTAAAAAVVYTL